jgi:hypothetical protein
MNREPTTSFKAGVVMQRELHFILLAASGSHDGITEQCL